MGEKDSRRGRACLARAGARLAEEPPEQQAQDGQARERRRRYSELRRDYAVVRPTHAQRLERADHRDDGGGEGEDQESIHRTVIVRSRWEIRCEDRWSSRCRYGPTGGAGGGGTRSGKRRRTGVVRASHLPTRGA